MAIPIKKRAIGKTTKISPGRLKKRISILANPKVTGVSDRPMYYDPKAPLSDRAKLMLDHYISMPHPSPYQAYHAAGFLGEGRSGAVAAHEIFNAPNFQIALREAQAFRNQVMAPERNAFLRRLNLLLSSNILDVCSWHGNNLILKDSSELTRDQTYAISEIRQTSNGISVKMVNKLPLFEIEAAHWGYAESEAGKGQDLQEIAKAFREVYDGLNASVPIQPPSDPESDGSDQGET